MNNHQNALPAIVYTLILLLINANGLPYLFGTQDNRRHFVEYQMPDDNWNITRVPRSITPHLALRDDSISHSVPPTKTEDELMNRLSDIKVSFLSDFFSHFDVVSNYMFVAFFSLFFC